MSRKQNSWNYHEFSENDPNFYDNFSTQIEHTTFDFCYIAIGSEIHEKSIYSYYQSFPNFLQAFLQNDKHVLVILYDTFSNERLYPWKYLSNYLSEELLSKLSVIVVKRSKEPQEYREMFQSLKKFTIRCCHGVHQKIGVNCLDSIPETSRQQDEVQTSHAKITCHWMLCNFIAFRQPNPIGVEKRIQTQYNDFLTKLPYQYANSTPGMKRSPFFTWNYGLDCTLLTSYKTSYNKTKNPEDAEIKNNFRGIHKYLIQNVQSKEWMNLYDYSLIETDQTQHILFNLFLTHDTAHDSFAFTAPHAETSNIGGYSPRKTKRPKTSKKRKSRKKHL